MALCILRKHKDNNTSSAMKKSEFSMLEKRNRLKRLQYEESAMYHHKSKSDELFSYHGQHQNNYDVIKAEPESDDGRRSPEYVIESKPGVIRTNSTFDSTMKLETVKTNSTFDSTVKLEVAPTHFNTDNNMEINHYPSNYPFTELSPNSHHSSESHSSYSQVKRIRANDRERRRVHLINRAMDGLRNVIPGLKDRKKLTKLEILRAANQYIWVLDEAMRTGRSIEELFGMLARQPVVYCVSYACMPVLKREPRHHDTN